MYINNKQVLVTGAAGFIGSHLTESLARAGYQVRAMVHYNFQNSWGWLETIPSDGMKNIEVFSADITENVVGKTINCGRGQGVSIGELAQMILEICESKATIETDTKRVRPEKSDVMELICDNSLARELMGWEPKYSLQEGLEETVAWMRENLDRYKTDIYNV